MRDCQNKKLVANSQTQKWTSWHFLRAGNFLNRNLSEGNVQKKNRALEGRKFLKEKLSLSPFRSSKLIRVRRAKRWKLMNRFRPRPPIQVRPPGLLLDLLCVSVGAHEHGFYEQLDADGRNGGVPNRVCRGYEKPNC